MFWRMCQGYPHEDESKTEQAAHATPFLVLQHVQIACVTLIGDIGRTGECNGVLHKRSASCMCCTLIHAEETGPAFKCKQQKSIMLYSIILSGSMCAICKTVLQLYKPPPDDVWPQLSA